MEFIFNANNNHDYIINECEISFFKIIYKKHTKFSKQTIRTAFDNTPQFGKIASVSIPKSGDFIKNAYLEVILPNLNHLECHVDNDNNNNDNCYKNHKYIKTLEYEYQAVLKYIELLRIYIVQYNNSLNCDNNNNLDIFINNRDIILTVVELVLNQNNKPIVDVNIFNYDHPTIDIIIILKQYLTQFATIIYENMCKYIPPKIKYVKKTLLALIKYIEIKIDGFTINKQYNNWLNIYFELFLTEHNYQMFLRMITYDNDNNNNDLCCNVRQILRLPLSLWFCYNNFPLFLTSQNLLLNIKFAKFENIIKTYDCSKNMSFKCPQLRASLLIDYYYITEAEKHLFISDGIIYCVKQTQQIKVNEVMNGINLIDLDEIVGPVTNLYWILKPKLSCNNVFHYKKIIASELTYNGKSVFPKLSGNYFNYVQPLYHYSRTPSKHVYTYSFSLFPSQYNQPSGSSNFTDINGKKLSLTIKSDNICDYDIVIYAETINLLRFYGGYCGMYNLY